MGGRLACRTLRLIAQTLFCFGLLDRFVALLGRLRGFCLSSDAELRFGVFGSVARRAFSFDLRGACFIRSGLRHRRLFRRIACSGLFPFAQNLSRALGRRLVLGALRDLVEVVAIAEPLDSGDRGFFEIAVHREAEKIFAAREAREGRLPDRL